MSLNYVLKKKQLHFQFFLLTMKLNYLHDLKIMLTCYLPSCGFYEPYTMDRNNYIEIHPTQAQVAKNSYHHPSKYLNQNVSPQLQYLLFRIMCLFSDKWVCKQVLNDHNLLCSLQCKFFFIF